MIRDLGPKIPLNEMYSAPAEDDAHYHDFDEGPSLDAALRRETLVDEIISFARDAVNNAPKDAAIKGDIISQRQLIVGNPGSYTVKAVQIGSMTLVQQKLDNPTEYEQRPHEFITIELPNGSDHLVMSKMPIRALFEIGKNAETIKVGAFGFITDPAREAIVKLCGENQLWVDWLLSTFTFPAYATDPMVIGSSVVALAPFNNKELGTIREKLGKVLETARDTETAIGAS